MGGMEREVGMGQGLIGKTIGTALVCAVVAGRMALGGEVTFSMKVMKRLDAPRRPLPPPR